jgi:DNA-binding PadR family transcriptional regulator
MSQQEIESQDDVSAIDLTAFQKETLLVIVRLEESNEESYGLGIKSSLENRLDQEVNHGRLYPNLDDLVERDLIEKSELDKRTNRYKLTENGKKLLQDYNDYIEDVVLSL